MTKLKNLFNNQKSRNSLLENKVKNLENENAEMKNMIRAQFKTMQDQFHNFQRYILLKYTVGNFCQLI